MKAVPELTLTEVQRLQSFLRAPARPEGTMGYCELAGFLFAVACSPELIKPSDWLPLVLGGERMTNEGSAEAEPALEAMMALYNWINHGVFGEEPVLPPGCEARTDALANLEPDAPLSRWAQGFQAGHSWLDELWDSYTPPELDEEVGADIMVLSFFGSQRLAQSFVEEVARGRKTLEEMADNMLAVFPQAMNSYARIGRSIAVVLQAAEHVAAKPRKVGRNDPCPCGSGKKYKKCCGAAGKA